MVLVVPLALPVLRDSKEFAVKLENLVQLAHPEVVDHEVFLVFLAKMLASCYFSFHFYQITNPLSCLIHVTYRVKLVKTVSLDPLALLDPQVLEAYQECLVCPVSKVTVVFPVWTDLKENLALVARKEHKV